MSTWLLLLFLVAGCGASARAKSLETALATVDALRVSLEKYDPEHQVAIARNVKARGGTREEAIAEQEAWREKRDALYLAIIATYAAIIVAVENDKKPVAGVARFVNELLRKAAEAGVPVGAAKGVEP